MADRRTRDLVLPLLALLAYNCYAAYSCSWMLSRIQGGCLEPKWRWPFWYSAAPFLTSSCIHPIDGVVGSCGSAQPFRHQQLAADLAWAGAMPVQPGAAICRGFPLQFPFASAAQVVATKGRCRASGVVGFRKTHPSAFGPSDVERDEQGVGGEACLPDAPDTQGIPPCFEGGDFHHPHAPVVLQLLATSPEGSEGLPRAEDAEIPIRQGWRGPGEPQGREA